ncbi:MAG: receptor with intracellular metal dependent phosphohydrolase [Firmicutes bacterium]|nr:receptor with intracellular metal dependent phosphohydrolase [Bacillota bacterium]
MAIIDSQMRDFLAHPMNRQNRLFARRIMFGMFFFVFTLLALSTDFISDKISLQAGQVSDRDIVASRSISYINAAKTKKLEAEVLASVATVYDLDVAVSAKLDEMVGAIFRAAQKVKSDPMLSTTEQKVNTLQAMSPVPLPSSTLTGLLNLNSEGLNKSNEYTVQLLHKYFQRGIRDDDLDVMRKKIVIDVEEMGLAKDGEAVVAGIAQTLLQPNFILNVRETDKRKQIALASVEPVRETVKKGQVLVLRGDVVTEEQIRMMEELGLHKGSINSLRIFGLSLFIVVIMAMTLGYLYKFENWVFNDEKQIVLMGLILLVSIFLGKIAHFYSDFAAPMAAGALLTAILIDKRIGLGVSIVLALFFAVISDNGFRPIAVLLAGSIFGIFSVSKMTHGYSLTKAGIWISAVNFITIIATGLIEQANITQLLTDGVIGALNGIAVAVLTIGMLPYLENTFNITTSIKLLELTKPNHPLLQRLLVDAPGTYHHSVFVGNLAETAADYVGANPIIVRVGAFYHDIGKIKRPYFFVENQIDAENPHDKISPSLSTLIVTSHLKDGVDLCRDYKLPQVILDVVQQHHGTTLVSYFYQRATENEHGECIIEADFRYEGPRPQTKEAALVMLADSCEAAVRSISRPNANRIEATVRKIIRERLHDGQLDECDLTLRDLNVIGDVYIRILSGMFHPRVEYPEALKELERRKAKNGNCNKQCTGKDESNTANGNNVACSVK